MLSQDDCFSWVSWDFKVKKRRFAQKGCFLETQVVDKFLFRKHEGISEFDWIVQDVLFGKMF